MAGCGQGQVAVRPPVVASARTVVEVVDLTGDRPRSTTVVTDLAAPYRARVLTYEGASEQGRSLGGSAWDETGVYTLGPDGSAAQTEYLAAGFAGPANHLLLALPVAERQLLVTRLGAGQSRGRPCQRWLSLLPLDGAPFTAATGADRTESCVDRAGQVLSELWTVAGKAIRTRTLTAVRPGPDLAGLGLFDQRRPVALPTSGSAYVVTVSSAEKLAALLQIPVPTGPDGLTADRSVAVLDVDAQRQGFSREAAVLTWTGPAQLVVLRIERDLTGSGGRTVRGDPVDLGGLGTGRLEPVLAGLRITVPGPRGLRLVATADLPEPALLAWLRTLRF